MEYINLSQSDFEHGYGVENNLFNKKKREARKEARKEKKAARKTFRATKKSVGKAKAKQIKRASIKTAKATKATTLGRTKKAARKTKQAKRVMTKGTAGQRAKKAIKQTVKKVSLAPLIPLKGVMIAGLKQQGIAVSKRDKIDKIANLFYNHVVRKHHDYEDLAELHFNTYDEDNLAPIVIGVVDAIIDFIKKAKAKKDKGEKLTKLEEVTVKGTEAAETQLTQKAQEAAAQEVGQRILFDSKTQIMIAAAILLLILLFRK